MAIVDIKHTYKVIKEGIDPDRHRHEFISGETKKYTAENPFPPEYTDLTETYQVCSICGRLEKHIQGKRRATFDDVFKKFYGEEVI